MPPMIRQAMRVNGTPAPATVLRPRPRTRRGLGLLVWALALGAALVAGLRQAHAAQVDTPQGTHAR